MELKELCLELKRTRHHLKMLNAQKTECEKRILNYLQTNEQPGIRFENMTIMIEDKERRTQSKKADRIERAAALLDRIGIDDSRTTVAQLIEAMRGEPEIQQKIKIL